MTMTTLPQTALRVSLAGASLMTPQFHALEKMQEAQWQRAAEAWVVHAPAAAFRDTATLSRVVPRSSAAIAEEQDAAARLRLFQAWLDNLPEVPHLPDASLDRSNIY
jgi:hypothetical protein